MGEPWRPTLSGVDRRSDLWSPDGKLHALRGRGRVLNPDGSVAWEEPDWSLNAIANEGEAEILNVVFLASQAVRANYYLMLLTAAPSASTTLSTMTETVSGTDLGYSRQAIASADWGALTGTQPTTTTAAKKTFGPNTKGSDWVAITHVALGTASSGTSGKFILYVVLAGSTTIHNGQSFEYTLTASAT